MQELPILKNKKEIIKILERNLIYQGDCLEVMKNIDDKSIDMILCDLPYGTTVCKWDTVIPFEPLWEQYERIIKDNGAIVLFGQEPFSSYLRISNINLYKYDWKWVKNKCSGFLNCKNAPMKKTEDICVFSKGTTANGSKNNMKYYPQGLIKVDKSLKRYKNKDEGAIGNRPSRQGNYIREFENYPNNLLYFGLDNKCIHPTQKPVDLCEYLIKTYTNEGELVLDNCIGSGTTAVAALKCNRDFIGIEKDMEYVQLANQRIQVYLRDGIIK